jgi:hypothetical protein
MSQQRIRTFYISSKIALDALTVSAAFVLAFQFRQIVPFPRPYTGNDANFLYYLPMLVVQIVSDADGLLHQ